MGDIRRIQLDRKGGGRLVFYSLAEYELGCLRFFFSFFLGGLKSLADSLSNTIAGFLTDLLSKLSDLLFPELLFRSGQVSGRPYFT